MNSKSEQKPWQDKEAQKRVVRSASHHHPNSNALIADGRGGFVRNDTMQRIGKTPVVKRT